MFLQGGHFICLRSSESRDAWLNLKPGAVSSVFTGDSGIPLLKNQNTLLFIPV